MKIKSFILLTCCILTCISTFAQFEIRKQKTVGGNQFDVLNSIDITRDSGYILGGESYSGISGDKTDSSRGDRDYWVIKLDKTGKIQWDKTLGGQQGEYFRIVLQTNDGGYILGGDSYSDISGDKTEPNRGQIGVYGDYWIVKLDSQGNIEWDKTIGGSKNEGLYAIKQTNDGGYILGGFSASDISGDKTEISRGDTDYWIVKIDQSGNVLWDKTIGGRGDDRLYALELASDGGYIAAGYSYSGKSGEKTQNRRGLSDYWVVKLDSLGNVEYDKTIGGTDFDFLTSMEQTSDSGYILGGYSSSPLSGEKTEASKGGWDYWLVKLNKKGHIQWDKTIGSSGDDYFYSLTTTSDKGIIAGGTSDANISGDKTENSVGYDDFWLAKLDQSGHIEWDKTIGGYEADWLQAVKELTRNVYILAGSSSSGKGGDKTQNSRGDSDYWVVALQYKKDSTESFITDRKLEGINLNLSVNNRLSVYPNPARDQITIQSMGKALFVLTNQSGKTVLSTIITDRGTIKLDNIPAGVYYLKNQLTGATQKIIVVK